MPRITITISEKTPQPYRFQLDRQSVTLGRGSDNDIAIDCRSVSGKHAEMRRIDGGYELRDTQSTNGIKCNGERHEVIKLVDGIAVTLGDVVLNFLLTDEEKEALLLEKPKPSLVVEEKKEEAGGDLGKKPPVVPKKVSIPVEQRGTGGFLMVLIFIVLATWAFFAGMAVRHQKDTGHSLFDAIKMKMKAIPPPAGT